MNKFISKKEVKYLSSLNQKKFRKLYNELIIEGEKLIFDSIKHNQNIKKIVYSKKNKNFAKLNKLCKQKNIPLNLCTEKDSYRISDTKNSQQIFGLMQCNEITNISDFSDKINKPFIVLDGISDPGNMGTILRTCSWFGCYNIIMTSDCVEFYNPKTIRSAMGAHFHLDNIFMGSVEQILEYLNEFKYQIFTASLIGENLENIKLKNNNWVLILGNETKGISNDFEKISHKIHIPGKGKMESLNVAEAASIVIHYLSKF